MGLCTYCQAIPVELFDARTDPEEDEYRISHQPSYRRLEISAQGCGLCELLRQTIREEVRGDISALVDEPEEETLLC